MENNEKNLRHGLGEALRTARLAKGLTQGQLAEMLDTDPETISRFERGATLPSLVRLLSLAEALGVTTASLLGAASPRADDEWDELRKAVNGLDPKHRQLAAALMKTMVEQLAR